MNYLKRGKRRPPFGSLADARAWRSEAQTALNRGTLRAPSRTTLAEAEDVPIAVELHDGDRSLDYLMPV